MVVAVQTGLVLGDLEMSGFRITFLVVKAFSVKYCIKGRMNPFEITKGRKCRVKVAMEALTLHL